MNPADILRYEQMLRYELAAMDAADGLKAFCQFTMPHPKAPHDPSKSAFIPARHLDTLIDTMEAVERREVRKVIVVEPPRHGKTETGTKRSTAWIHGRNPHWDIIVATYGEIFAKNFARDIKGIIDGARFQQAFPDYALVSTGVDALANHMGKNIFCLGRRSPTTGRGGNVLIVDDPVKDDKEARSQVFRDDLWEWFTQTLLSRRHDDKAPVVLTMCMTGDTPVLMADGREVALEDIRVGDRIATYENGALSVSTVRAWANQGPDQVFIITMKSGATVRANARHPFLVAHDGGLEWRRTASLRRGDRILRAIGGSTAASHAPSRDVSARRSAGACAHPTTTKNDGPLGHGRLRSILWRAARGAFAIAMALILRNTRRGWRAKAASAPSASSHPAATFAPIGMESCASIIATIAGRSEGFSVTTAISPLATEKAKRSYGPPLNTFAIIPDEIESVTPGGVDEVFDIQVDRTENFIANGLVSHNTRWHEDDIVGRITDKTNPKWSRDFSEGWEIIRLPAIAEEDDPLGRAPGEALWPERFGLEYLEQMKAANPVAFSALYQGNPTPAEGAFFLVDDLNTYERDELPPLDQMRVYGVSDHGVGTATHNDPSCLLLFGVDPKGTAWVLPDLAWRRMGAVEQVDEWIRLVRSNNPIWWWAERGQISKSIGPFLRKRMQEEGVYCPILEEAPVGDKIQRAQSARARCSQGRIRFPAFTSWWSRARHELLTFPNGKHDDFVDALSLVGLKLQAHQAGTRAVTKVTAAPGTWGALKSQWKSESRDDEARRARAGW